MAIPYPKREFLSDEDEDKSDNNKANNHPENNHGPSGGKRVRISGMAGPNPVQPSNMAGNSGHGLQTQQNLQYSSNGAQQTNPNYGQRY